MAFLLSRCVCVCVSERERERERERRGERAGSSLQAGSGHCYKRRLVFLLCAFHFSLRSSSHLKQHLNRMSWQGYIDQLLETKVIEEVAICGIKEGAESVWVSTPGMNNVTGAEIKNLAANYKNFAMCGPHIGGKKCILVKDMTDDKEVRCLNLKVNDSDGSRAMAVGRTVQAIIIAKGKKDVTSGALATSLFKIIEYLRGTGY